MSGYSGLLLTSRTFDSLMDYLEEGKKKIPMRRKTKDVTT